MRSRLAAAAVAVAVAALIGPTAVAASPPTVQIAGDKFSKEITFVGPAADVNPFGGTTRTWRIRSWLNRDTKTVAHQLYVEINYIGGWRWYSIAANDNAETMPVVKIASQVGSCLGGCIMYETVGIELPTALLRARATTGFQVKLTAQSGDTLVLDVKPNMIGPQLQAIDGYTG